MATMSQLIREQQRAADAEKELAIYRQSTDRILRAMMKAADGDAFLKYLYEELDLGQWRTRMTDGDLGLPLTPSAPTRRESPCEGTE